MAVKVAVLDDNEIWRDSLERFLKGGGFDVVASSNRSEEFLSMIRTTSPQVALVDLRMPPSGPGEGILVAQRARELQPGVGIIILSGYEEDLRHYFAEQASRKLSLGALGFLYKDRITPSTLYQDVTRVMEGKSVIDSVLAAEFIEGLSSQVDFTREELEVIRLLVAGFTNRQMADKLHASTATVERALSEVFRKLLPGDSSRLEQDANQGENRRVLAAVEWVRRMSTG